MLCAAELINSAWCETEDGFPGPLGGFIITGALLVPSTATTTCHQTHARLRDYVYVSGT